MIEVRNLTKYFGKLKVLDDVNLSFDKPGIYAILGPNSSGKTTLMKSILGMVIPQSGKINFNGEIVNGSYRYRNDISYMPQIAHFPENLRAGELISIIKDIRKSVATDEDLIADFYLANHLDKTLKNLSGGTKQKINTVLALMFDTPYLFLDEPTAGLDPVVLLHFKELIMKLRNEGKIIILTTHIINLVEEIADNVIFLLEGKIYFTGTVNDLIKKAEGNNLEEAIANILKANGNA